MRIIAITVIAIVAAPLLADQARLERAERLVEEKPTAWRALGYLEMQRAAGVKNRSIRKEFPNAEHYEALLEADLWRRIPASVTQRSSIGHSAQNLLDENRKNAWAVVIKMWLAASSNDRTALVECARLLVESPAAFPSVAAEKAHFELLKELGADDLTAGLEVIAGRNYAPLHAVMELDRVLTREAEFLAGTSKSADAKTLTDARDRLRQAYLDSSKHLIERLFALHLLGRTQDCDALLFAARELPWLSDANELSKLMARLDRKTAWEKIVSPLLAGEVALINKPPQLPATMPADTAELKITSKSKSTAGGIVTYSGAVRVRIRDIDIACEQLAIMGDEKTARLISGTGGVAIKGVAGIDQAQAENFTFNLDSGAFSLGGNVRLKRADKETKLKACTIGQTGEVRDTVSLLDDFDATPDVQAKLGMLPAITAVYRDEELPLEARFLQAMQLVRPHLRWHEWIAAREGEVRLVDRAVVYDEDDRWTEAHAGEPWMRDEGLAQIHGKGKANRVEALLARHSPAGVFWTLDDASHADVARARKLLESIGDGQYRAAARRWTAELGRNNTVVTFDVCGGYAPGKAAPVVMDVRGAEKVTFQLYRVSSAQTLLAAADQIGDDFIFRDYGLQFGLAERM
jgi:lipopolysaccharide export system protein LptA